MMSRENALYEMWIVIVDFSLLLMQALQSTPRRKWQDRNKDKTSGLSRKIQF